MGIETVFAPQKLSGLNWATCRFEELDFFWGSGRVALR